MILKLCGRVDSKSYSRLSNEEARSHLLKQIELVVECKADFRCVKLRRCEWHLNCLLIQRAAKLASQNAQIDIVFIEHHIVKPSTLKKHVKATTEKSVIRRQELAEARVGGVRANISWIEMVGEVEAAER